MVVHNLRTAWEKEQAKRHKVISVAEAWVKYESDIAAPPSLVWDYITTPELKARMIGLDFVKRTDENGGRVREEAKFHCAHGEVEFFYKIVDWKPFEYFTIVQTDSMTHLEYYETYYFIPNMLGTHFMSCVGLPTGSIPAEAQAMFQGMWDQSYGKIKGYIEQEIATGKVTVTPQAPTPSTH